MRFFLPFLLLIIGAGCAGKSDIQLVDPGQSVELTGTPFFPQEKYQCGPAALAMVLGASGVAIHPDDLTPAIYLPDRRGSLQVEIVAAARRMERIPLLVSPHLSSLVHEIRSGRPVLVLQNLGLKSFPVYHYAVVIGVQGPDRLVLRSGTKKRTEMTAARFNRTWQKAGSWGLIVLRPGDIPGHADPDAYVAAVAAFEAGGHVMPAARAYQAALNAWPDNPDIRFALANNCLRQGNHSGAAALYRDILAADPDHAAAANNLAEAMVLSGDLPGARKVIEAAVKTAEKSGSPLLQIIRETRQEIEQMLQETKQP